MDPRRGHKTFPILGDPPFSLERAEKAKAELIAAIIPKETISFKERRIERIIANTPEARLASSGVLLPNAPYETVMAFNVQATFLYWTFFRSWYYWRANTTDYPIPEDLARSFNQDWCNQVRVDGFADGTSVHGPIYHYHIDTPEGLAQFVRLLKSIVSPNSPVCREKC